MRLDKYLADMGVGTRKEVRQKIRDGHVTVGGAAAVDPGMKVDEADEVCLDGRPLCYEKFVYYMLNKPAGVVSASRDSRERTVIDLMCPENELGRTEAGGNTAEPQERAAKGPGHRADLFPVGRLDKDTEGLLLITDDGELAHRLLSPKRHVDKVYYARLDGPVGDREKLLFAEGLQVEEGWTALPAKLTTLAQTSAQCDGVMAESDEPSEHVLVTIHEGKFHQIKRMFAAVGRDVQYLKRLSMGPLTLDEELAPGQWRRLTKEEVSAIIGA